MLAPGGEDVPAAVRPTVHPAGGGAAALRERRGGAIAGTGHTVEKGGNAASQAHITQKLRAARLLGLFMSVSDFIIKMFSSRWEPNEWEWAR